VLQGVKKMRKVADLLLSLVMENGGNRLSHRKIMAFIFLIYVGWMLVATYLSNNGDLYSDMVWISIIGGALGISYIRQLSHTNYIKNNKQNGEDG